MTLQLQLQRPTLDRGAVALEGVNAWGLGLLTLMAFFTVVMWGLAKDSARAAAEAALYDAQMEYATAGDGIAIGSEVVDVRAGQTLQNAEVTVDRGEETVTVTVTGDAYPVPLPIEVTLAGPVERFVPEGAGR
ncbi:hypothetical protein [Glycomyces sp. MUSA5-2]|uniref:hypothetical protein n=1 Tax=Glycomyces sp. MUSA5-2 TaxID=2053002 RepID=UPI00300B33E1